MCFFLTAKVVVSCSLYSLVFWSALGRAIHRRLLC